MVVAVWNVRWATASRAERCRVALAKFHPDVVIATEAVHTGARASSGEVIDAGADWGERPGHPGRRKVVMWSRWGWDPVDTNAPDSMPPGRWVVGATTPSGGATLTFAGACIPWSGARATAAEPRARWEDHRAYLEALGPLLADRTRRFVLAGDFNQRYPERPSTGSLAAALRDALGPLAIATGTDQAADVGGWPVPLIDHLAHLPDLHAEIIGLLPRRMAADDGDLDMSDHTGVVLRIGSAAPLG